MITFEVHGSKSNFWMFHSQHQQNENSRLFNFNPFHSLLKEVTHSLLNIIQSPVPRKCNVRYKNRLKCEYFMFEMKTKADIQRRELSRCSTSKMIFRRFNLACGFVVGLTNFS